MHKLMMKIGFGLLGKKLKDSSLYEPLKGRKRIIGLMFGILTILLMQFPDVPTAVTEVVAGLAGVFLSLGWIDAKYRDSPFTGATGWYVFLRDHWTWVTGLAAGLVGYLTKCEGLTAKIMGTLHLECSVGITVIGVLVALLGWAVGAAKLATPEEKAA